MRLALALVALFAATPAFAAPTPITGRWLTDGGKAIVDVAPCGAQLCGRIARVVKVVPGRPTTDVNNPDTALRGRPIVGLSILSGFTPAKDRWKGHIYDPESGRTYRSELTATGNVLKVKGCYGPFCRSQNWTRVR